MKHRIVEENTLYSKYYIPQYRCCFIWFTFPDEVNDYYKFFETLQEAEDFIDFVVNYKPPVKNRIIHPYGNK